MIDYMILNNTWGEYTDGFATLEQAKDFIESQLDNDPASVKTDFIIYKRERIDA